MQKDTLSLLLFLGVKEKTAANFSDKIDIACQSNKIEKKMFVAQACHESMMFSRTREIWGPTDAQKRYEYNKDLGNNQAGDGLKFRGRGVFQITGKDNYASCSVFLFNDRSLLLKEPEKLEDPKYAVLSAAWFWKIKKLEQIASFITGKVFLYPAEDDQIAVNNCNLFKQVTKKINGGYNGLEERVALYNKIVQFYS